MADDSDSKARATGFKPRLIGALFDTRFSGFLAADMVPVIYRFGIGVAALATVAVIVWAALLSWIAGAIWLLLLGPAMFLTLVVGLRVMLEFVLAVFRINAELHAMESRLGEVVRELREADQILGRVDYNVESVDRRIHAIQQEFPRLAFWRKGADKKSR